MPARKSVPPKTPPSSKQPAAPHGPTDGKDKPAARKPKATKKGSTPRKAGAKVVTVTTPTRPDVEVFIAEYLRDSNGKRAAIAAGYCYGTERQAAMPRNRVTYAWGAQLG